MGILAYERNPGMAKTYLSMNPQIVGAFVWKEGPRRFQVLEGEPQKSCGFVVAEVATMREAKSLCSRANAVILAARGEDEEVRHA